MGYGYPDHSAIQQRQNRSEIRPEIDIHAVTYGYCISLQRLACLTLPTERLLLSAESPPLPPP